MTLVVVVRGDVREGGRGARRGAADVPAAWTERRGDDAEVQVVDGRELRRKTGLARSSHRRTRHVPPRVDAVRIDEPGQQVADRRGEVALLVGH